MVLLHSKHMIVLNSKTYFEDVELNIIYFSHCKIEKIIFVIVTAGAGPSVVSAHNFPSLPATTSIRWQNLSVSTRNCERQSTSSCKGRGGCGCLFSTKYWDFGNNLATAPGLSNPRRLVVSLTALLSEACLVFVATSVPSCCARAQTGGVAWLTAALMTTLSARCGAGAELSRAPHWASASSILCSLL